MEAYLGKWQSGEATNSEAIMKALGMPEEHAAAMKDGFSYTSECSVNGNVVTFVVNMTKPAGYPPKTYDIPLNTPTVVDGMFGDKVEMTLTLEGTKLKESFNDKDKGKQWTTEWEVNGNTLTLTTTAYGVVSTQTLTKC